MLRFTANGAGWGAIADALASLALLTAGVLALAACSPVRSPSPTEQSRETSAVAPAEAAARAQTGPPAGVHPADLGEPGVVEPASIASAETAPPSADLNRVQAGDIIFHVSRSAQSKAIQLATKSQYSHVGIVESGAGGWVVLEAVEPVKRTPIDEWIARGVDGRFVVKRLKRASELLTSDAAVRLRAAGARFIGKRYDTAFGWSDDRIYCSELVYKVYHEVLEIELAPLQRLREFDLSHALVRAKLIERYGKQLPLDEPVVSPAAIFDSPALTVVIEK